MVLASNQCSSSNKITHMVDAWSDPHPQYAATVSRYNYPYILSFVGFYYILSFINV